MKIGPKYLAVRLDAGQTLRRLHPTAIICAGWVAGRARARGVTSAGAARAARAVRTVRRLVGMQGLLSEMSVQSDHRVLTAREGFAPIDRTEVALVASPDASPATLRLADRLAEFCDKVQAKAA